MPEFTADQLTTLLRECAGEDEAVDLDGDILDDDFEELGYDSLALLNTVARIERDLSIKLPDTLLTDARTPRGLITKINDELSQKA